MSYFRVLNVLSKIIEERDNNQKYFVRSSSFYYLIRALHQSYSLDEAFKKYVDTGDDDLDVIIMQSSNFASFALARSLENKDLPPEITFVVSSLLDMMHPLHDLVLDLENAYSNLNDFLKSNGFIIKTLEDTCSRVKSLGFSFEPKGSHFNEDVIDWWKNR